MAKHDDYFVEPRGGKWIVKKPHAERVSAIVDTQKEAIDKAKAFAPEGVINVKSRDGKFRKA
jgi:Uncharacterized protein conserved in bacteria (DUF2188)